jgi:dipeptidyl aminopeptidase/acylaminoacyl peptidase
MRPLRTRSTRLRTSVWFLAVAWAVATVASTAERTLTLGNLWTLRGFSAPHWSPDGRSIAFTLSEPEANTNVLYIAGVDGSVRRMATAVLDAPKGKPRASLSLLPQPWTPDSKRLLFTSDQAIKRIDIQSGEIRTLVQFGTSSKGYLPQVYFNGPDPVLSPDGTRLAYVRESELWVLDLAEGGVRQLTSTFGKGWHNLEPAWSPDGKRLLYTAQEVDEQRRFPFTDFSKTILDVSFSLIGYGHVRVGVIPAGGGDTVWLGPSEGLRYSLRGGSRARWSPDGTRIAINRLSLDHTRREILIGSPDEGKLTTIFTEKVEHWISPMAIWIRWSPDSKHLLFTSEQDGWNHVFVAEAAGGAASRLTTGHFTVTSNQVYENEESTPDWSRDGRTIYFTSNEVAPSERHLYAVPAVGGSRRRITSLEGLDYASAVAPDDGYVAYLHSDITHLPELYVQPVASGEAKRLTDLATPASLRGFVWQEAQIVTFPANDRTPIAARLYKPAGLDKSRQYPAVVYIHGAGYTQSVYRGWAGLDRLAFNQYLAQEGFVVLDVDYRGSSGYGAKFRLDVFNRLGDIDLQDVVAGVDYLKSLGYVAPTRIGIWGHSYGGFLVASAMLRAPDTFAAGAAGAPVTDWERFFYLAPGYNEEHLGFPWENMEGTKRASPLTYANQLKHPLLILSGIQDTMHLDSAALVNALLEDGKPVDWFFYPNEAHGFRQPQAREDYYRRIADFLKRCLHDGAVAATSGE